MSVTDTDQTFQMVEDWFGQWSPEIAVVTREEDSPYGSVFRAEPTNKTSASICLRMSYAGGLFCLAVGLGIDIADLESNQNDPLIELLDAVSRGEVQEKIGRFGSNSSEFRLANGEKWVWNRGNGLDMFLDSIGLFRPRRVIDYAPWRP